MNKIEQLIKDKTFFTEFYDLATGKKVIEVDSRWFHEETMADEEPFEVHKDLIVEVSFNEEVIERFNRLSPRTVSQRGIKSADNITATDDEVKRLIDKARKRSKNKKVVVGEAQISALVQQVKRVHEPHATLAIYQTLVLTLLYNNFTVIPNKAIDFKFDVEIPDEYWNGATIKTDPLEAMLEEFQPLSPYFDPNNALEIMIAFVTQLISKYEAFAEAFQQVTARAFAGLTYWNGRSEYDDAGFLSRELDRILSEIVARTSKAEQPEDTPTGD